MLTDRRKHDLTGTTDDEHRHVNRQEVHGSVNHVVPDTGGIVACKRSNQGVTPALIHGDASFSQIAVGLEADIPHAKEHGREYADPDRDHYPLEVDAITNVSVRCGH